MCVCARRNNEMGWKQRCCHTYVCTLAVQKSMKSYTNGDIYIACSIALLCQDTRLPSGTGSSALFPPRKKQREEGTVNYTDRGNGPTGRGREMKRCNYEEETEKCWNQGRAGQSFVSEGESTFPQISPLLNQEQHLITTLQATWGP